MTYGEFKSYVMQLINQYSARGTELTGSYNDQDDYFVRIPGLYNAAMLDIAMEASPILAVMSPSEDDVTDIGNGFVTIKVPTDYVRMTGDGIPLVRDGKMTRVKSYYYAGSGTVVVRKDLYEHGILEYYREPNRLPISGPVDEGTALDGTLEMQTTAAYYVAAMLVIQDDPFAYSAFRNEYDDKFSQMKRRLRAEAFFIDDVMDLPNDPY